MMGKLSRDNWCMEQLHYNMLDITPQASPHSPFSIPIKFPEYIPNIKRGFELLVLIAFDTR
jgi:hypothetical protein